MTADTLIGDLRDLRREEGAIAMLRAIGHLIGMAILLSPEIGRAALCKLLGIEYRSPQRRIVEDATRDRDEN